MCTCHAEIDKKLKPMNGRLATGFIFHRGGQADLSLLMQVERIETRSRKKPPHVLPAFCPFCGEKIKSTRTAVMAQDDGTAPSNDDGTKTPPVA